MTSVAIIGAGLSGLTLALALHQQNIPSTIYESRPAPLNIGGAVMLSPNALKVLNALGVYDRIRTKGYNFEHLEYRNHSGKVIETQEFGSEAKYGFKGLRVYRHVLITELLAMLEENHVPIIFGRKFAKVIDETEEEVTWEFTDGTRHSASLLIGADGIHSTVRRYLYPDITPTFTGMAGITAAIPTAQLALPPKYHIPVTLTSPTGSFVIAPQHPSGSEVLIGKQLRLADRDRAAWDAFAADKEYLVDLLRSDNELFPDIVRNATRRIERESVNFWPFYVVPRLARWTSHACRVVILGDAAHAIPPSAGQGVNQAFEDVYVLALVMGRMGGDGAMREGLEFWRAWRGERIQGVERLNAQIDLRRLPRSDEGERAVGRAKGDEREEIELGWLYAVDFEGVVDAWVEKRGLNVKG